MYIYIRVIYLNLLLFRPCCLLRWGYHVCFYLSLLSLRLFRRLTVIVIEMSIIKIQDQFLKAFILEEMLPYLKTENIATQNWWLKGEHFLLGRSIFRGYVNFREGNLLSFRENTFHLVGVLAANPMIFAKSFGETFAFSDVGLLMDKIPVFPVTCMIS